MKQHPLLHSFTVNDKSNISKVQFYANKFDTIPKNFTLINENILDKYNSKNKMYEYLNNVKYTITNKLNSSNLYFNTTLFNKKGLSIRFSNYTTDNWTASFGYVLKFPIVPRKMSIDVIVQALTSYMCRFSVLLRFNDNTVVYIYQWLDGHNQTYNTDGEYIFSNFTLNHTNGNIERIHKDLNILPQVSTEYHNKPCELIIISTDKYAGYTCMNVFIRELSFAFI